MIKIRFFNLALLILFFNNLFYSCSRQVDQEAIFLFSVGREAYEKGELERASRHFNSLNKKYKRFYQSQFMEGKTLFFMEKYGKAAQCFASLIEDEPSFTQAQLWLAKCFRTTGEVEKSKKILVQMLRYDPSDPRILYELALVNGKQGDFDEYLFNLQRAKAFREEYIYIPIDLAQFYYQNQMDSKALVEINFAMTLIEKNHPLYQGLLYIRDDIQKSIRKTFLKGEF